jgi:hypothetical protein
MKIPFTLFFKSIEEKKIYFFGKNNSFGVSEHMHICLKRPDGNILYFVCCTTKYNTIVKFIEKLKIDYSTIVYIAKDNKNCFNEDATYINCNNVHRCTKKEFENSYNNDSVTFIGEVSDNHYDQIIRGIKESPLIAQEIKDMLPSI